MVLRSRMSNLFATRSRKLTAAGAVGLVALAVALGAVYGFRPRPNPDVIPDPDGPAPPSAKPVHELDPAKHSIPAGPVTGVVGGSEFTAEASVEGDYLVFRTPPAGNAVPERKVSLQLRTGGGSIENRKLTVRPDTPSGPDVPPILVEAPALPRPDYYTGGYALTLELGTRKAGKLPGRIYLCFPDDKATFLAGTFEADCPRTPTDPPGLDDVPFVHGSVTVRNLGPRFDLRVGYLGITGPEQFVLGAGDIDIDPDAPPNRSSQFVYDKPRVTNLVAGDGKAVPTRYEHSRLAPGRYLVFVSLVGGGPVAWKWVTVTPTTTVTVDFTLDPAQTGGVEVGAPLEALGKAHLVPVNDHPGPVAVYPNAAYAIALHLRLEQDIVARKALFKNLAPGKYEVRAGGQIRLVEIVAGKTLELDFDRKPPEPKK
jgi:hypothetical protein